jgi:hypothetical protein
MIIDNWCVFKGIDKLSEQLADDILDVFKTRPIHLPRLFIESIGGSNVKG